MLPPSVSRIVLFPGVTSADVTASCQGNVLGPFADELAHGSLHGKDLESLGEGLHFANHIERLGLGFVVTGHCGARTSSGGLSDLQQSLVPVSSLGLSVRSLNCLRTAGVATVRDLLLIEDHELFKLPNMGRKSMAEIEERIQELGINRDQTRLSPGKTIDLRLLLRITDLESTLASIVSRSGHRLVMNLSADSPLAIRNRLGRPDLKRLSEFLDRVGIPFGMVVPRWFPRLEEQIIRAFGEELLLLTEEFQTDKALAWKAEGLPKSRVSAAQPPTSLRDEIENYLLVGLKPNQKKIVSKRKGWDGTRGATLEEVAIEFGLTRERVRQIENKVKPIEPAGGFQFLKKALSIVEAAAPCLADHAESLLNLEPVEAPQVGLEGLFSAAKATGINHNLSVDRIGNRRFIATETDFCSLRLAEKLARTDVSHFGVGNLKRVCVEVQAVSVDVIEAYLRCLPDSIWDPTDPAAFYFPTKRNTLLNRLSRILALISPLRTEIARDQILRDSRMEGSIFSTEMLALVAGQQPWCCIRENEISRSGEYQSETGDDTNESILVALIQEHGPVIDSRVLQPFALQAGISEVHFNALLSSSPLIVRHDRALYGLIGSGAPTTSQGTNLAPVPPITQYVAGELIETEADPKFSWLGDDIDRDVDPLAPDFSLSFFQKIARRAKQAHGDKPWSMAEVLQPEDRRTLHLWGQHGSADLKWLRARPISYAGEQFAGRNALAFLFLAYSTEIAREQSSEGEMWGRINGSLNHDLKEQLLFSSGLAKPWLREATELICQKLNIRHAFRQQGEQSWLRTVYLQFGITRAGFRRLPYWLCGHGVPVAVRELTDRNSSIFSAQFDVLWDVLGNYRFGGCTESQARRQLTGNPWTDATSLEELLHHSIQQREIVRSDYGGLDDVLPTGQLLASPRLLWNDEPYFELSLAIPPPPWLNEQSYTLVVSDGQRIPVRSVGEKHEMVGVGKTLLVPAALASIEVDVVQKTVSLLSEKITIPFCPDDEWAVYRLADGKKFDPWDELPRGEVPCCVLHHSKSKIAPSPSEFRVVLAGNYILSAYRQGLPSDLRLQVGDETIWQRSEETFPVAVTEGCGPRAVCPGGQWGERMRFSVLQVPANLRPTHLVVKDQVCALNTDHGGCVSGSIVLEPGLAGTGTRARFVARDGVRLRCSSASIEVGPVTGAALDHLGRWIPLRGVETMPIASFRESIFVHPPETWRGEDFVEHDWAILEGDRKIGVPSRSGHRLAHILSGLGEELRLAVNNEGEWWRGFKFARAVIDNGLFRNVADLDDGLTIDLVRNVEIGADHDLWVWHRGAHTPDVVSKNNWRLDQDRIVVHASRDAVAGVALSFKGEWLGCCPVDANYSWECLRASITGTTDWSSTAAWLRWFRVPILVPELRDAVSSRALAEAAETYLAWNANLPPSPHVQFSEEHEERWAQATRHYLCGWKPTAEDALRVLRELRVLPTDPIEIVQDFERTREGWPNCEALPRVDPGLFTALVMSALPVAYAGASAAELGVLVKILRKQIMGTDQELSLEDFSWRIGLDKSLAAEIIGADSLRRKRSLTLRIAMADYSVRQFVCVRLLDEALKVGER